MQQVVRVKHRGCFGFTLTCLKVHAGRPQCVPVDSSAPDELGKCKPKFRVAVGSSANAERTTFSLMQQVKRKRKAVGRYSSSCCLDE